MAELMSIPEKAGYTAFNEGHWSNPYEDRRGFDFEAWQWNLGWKLAKHMKEFA